MDLILLQRFFIFWIKYKTKSQSNKSSNNINEYRIKVQKIKNDIETQKTKIKKINSNGFRYKISDNKKTDTVNNDIKDNNYNIVGKSSNLFNKQIELVQNENIEKQKIEEFKNLLEQIVNEIEKWNLIILILN